MPLPPYIHETLQDQGRYQTVYAKLPGSAAAPTAGLHFTKELLQKIQNKGVNIALILQTGHGTGSGGYVQGIDYINPAMKPILQKIADEAWKEVTSS